MKWSSMNELCDVVRETSFAIHKYHRSGHLEKIYENALVHRLRKQGLKVEQQYPLAVYDEDGTELGQFFADVFVEDYLVDGDVLSLFVVYCDFLWQIFLAYIVPEWRDIITIG